MALGCASAPNSPTPTNHPPLIIVSLDGFRWDFDSLADTPNLDRLTREGVRAERMIPVFPSKTFPAHYTVVTGLRAEHHGIVANTMFDPELNERFTLSNRAAVGDGRWWGGEPLWVTAERQGKRAAVLFWPGSEAAIKGVRPTSWALYQHDLPPSDRIAQLARWLALPSGQRPAVMTLYFDHIDSAAHTYGTTSPELVATIEEIDAALGELLLALEPHGGLDAINLVLLADHGMTDLSPERLIVVDELVQGRAGSWENSWVVDWAPVLAVRPPPDRVDEVFAALDGAHPNLQVWRRDEVPEHFHYRDHPRIAPIIALADEGWTLTSREYLTRRPNAAIGANHGYDPYLPSMGALFVAVGPDFQQGHTVPPFESVQLYELFCEVLGLEPAPNDGERDALRSLLR